MDGEVGGRVERGSWVLREKFAIKVAARGPPGVVVSARLPLKVRAGVASTDGDAKKLPRPNPQTNLGDGGMAKGNRASFTVPTFSFISSCLSLVMGGDGEPWPSQLLSAGC